MPKTKRGRSKVRQSAYGRKRSRKSTSTVSSGNRSKRVRHRSKSVPRRPNWNPVSQPVQFGTGCWKSIGHGPKGSRKAKYVKGMEKMLAPQRYLYNTPYQIKATPGIQQSLLVGSTYDPLDLYNCNGGSQANVAGNIDQTKVILKDYTTCVNFTNQSNANVKLVIYDFICRRDVQYNAGGGSNASDPLTAWYNESETNASYNANIYGATPFDSQLMCKYWKCIGSQEYRLAQGETGEHRLHNQMNKVFDFSQLAGNIPYGLVIDAYAGGGFKGLTHYCLATISGSPTDAANTTVDISTAQVDFVTVNQYSWQQINKVVAKTVQTNTLGTAAGQVYNQGSGAAVTVANI